MSSAKRPEGRAARAPTSALERTISSLVRGDESDAELDRIVADLILKEAKEKEEARRGGYGAAAARADEASSRKSLDTRLLNGVIRDVQSHNRRAQEAPIPLSRHSSSNDCLRDVSAKRRSKMHGWSDDDREEGRSDEDRRRPRPSERDSRISASSHRELIDDRSRREHNAAIRSKAESRRHRRDSERHPIRRSASPPDRTHAVSHHHSKMDRYFAPGYDPMLDVGNGGSSAGKDDEDDQAWERVMGLVREREERKETREVERERRRQRRKEEKRRRSRESDNESNSAAVGKDALDTRYTQRGGTREWDKGKQASP